MFIKSLRIRNTVTDVVMREIFFHKGVNFVVDTEGSTKHNKVGKTTFLKLIDVLMGASDKKYVYVDQETNNEVSELRNIIVEKQVAVEMMLVRNLNEPYGKSVSLKVELFPRGRYFIDDERVSPDIYRQQLNELLFGITNNIPTFRQLIHSFVRVSVEGDSNAFLRTLTRTSNATYRSVYNFLFDISDPALDNELSKLNGELTRIQETVRRYKQVNQANDLEQQRQVLLALEVNYSKTKSKMDDILNVDDYKNNRETIMATRAEYTKLTDQLNELDYRIERNSEALKLARAEKTRKANLELSQRFFDEVCGMLPEINKTFEEMVTFNNKLCDNKISYFSELDKELHKKRAELAQERERLLDQNSQYLSLVTQDRIGEYEQLSSALVQQKQEIGRHEEVIDTLERFEKELEDIQKDIDSYSTGGSARKGKSEDYQSMMNSFNSFFTSLAQEINGESPILVYSPDTKKFPVSITEISGSSTGTRKSLIAAFDLAYQQFAIANDIHTPRFVVHDVVETVEGGDLSAIVKSANSIDMQYIVATLKEKLDSSEISDEDQRELQILQLADDNRLFEGSSVETAEASVKDTGSVEESA
ncbi:DUF2326 domain-containing protein [Lancefieldella rimae]|uniref:DUF2326 domain-containing protein n=1 Tax=Lancefieldella rimae TaxID=1383 RepID=UPI0028EDF4E4|nr:DUF2326 domain-containing protein [Lancefieldella rimae]